MTSTILPSRSPLSTGSQAHGDTLRDWSVTARRLANAALGALPWRTLAPKAPLTPYEEAARVREMATTYLKKDPGFAADLFAAADRFERSHEF